MPFDIENTFSFHPASGPKHDQVRSIIKTAANHLNSVVPECAEKTLMFRALQTAMFQANAAVELNSGIQYPTTMEGRDICVGAEKQFKTIPGSGT